MSFWPVSFQRASSLEATVVRTDEEMVLVGACVLVLVVVVVVVVVLSVVVVGVVVVVSVVVVVDVVVVVCSMGAGVTETHASKSSRLHKLLSTD